MLRSGLIHPDILSALGRAGHGSKVLLADGNYPHSTGASPRAERVHLAFRAGSPTVSEVLEAMVTAIAVEAAAIMSPADGPDPEQFGRFRELTGVAALDRFERFDFYAAARADDVALVVATGDTQLYANLLITIGTV